MNGSAGFSLRSDLVHSVYRIGVCQISDQFRRHCLLNGCDSVTIIASSPEKYLAGIVGPVPPQSYYDYLKNAGNFRAIRAIPGIRGFDNLKLKMPVHTNGIFGSWKGNSQSMVDLCIVHVPIVTPDVPIMSPLCPIWAWMQMTGCSTCLYRWFRSVPEFRFHTIP